MDDLIRQTEGRWSARVEVNQVYAHAQESHAEWHHPDGGQAFYLRDTVYLDPHLRRLADGLIDQWGVGVEEGLKGVAEDLAKGVFLRAPWEFNDLRKSGRPYVTRDNATVWERPAEVGRLSKEQLRLKRQVSYLLDPHRYTSRRFL